LHREGELSSDDGGDSWEKVPGISDHAHARKWTPGAGGLCLHTILRDRKRMHLGISTGGRRLYMQNHGGDPKLPGIGNVTPIYGRNPARAVRLDCRLELSTCKAGSPWMKRALPPSAG